MVPPHGSESLRRCCYADPETLKDAMSNEAGKCLTRVGSKQQIEQLHEEWCKGARLRDLMVCYG